MEVGKTFNSYSDYMKALSAYEKENFVKFYKRDSKILKGDRKDKNCIYEYLKFTCKQGGKLFRSNSNGKRPNTRSHRTTNCGAYTTINFQSKTKKLKIAQLNNEHNHTVSKVVGIVKSVIIELYQYYAPVRELEGEVLEETKNMVKMRANKKLIQSHVMTTSNKKITLKDLHNIQTRIKPDAAAASDLSSCIELLKNTYNCESFVLEQDGEFRGLQFQSKEMKMLAEAYPEFMCIDATYKLLVYFHSSVYFLSGRFEWR